MQPSQLYCHLCTLGCRLVQQKGFGAESYVYEEFSISSDDKAMSTGWVHHWYHSRAQNVALGASVVLKR